MGWRTVACALLVLVVALGAWSFDRTNAEKAAAIDTALTSCRTRPAVRSSFPD
jgi:hypothetical protein